MCCSCHKHTARAKRLGVSLERLAEAHARGGALDAPATNPATTGRRGRA